MPHFRDQILIEAQKTNQSDGHVYSGWVPRERDQGWLLVAVAVVAILVAGIAGAVAAEAASPAAAYVSK